MIRRPGTSISATCSKVGQSRRSVVPISLMRPIPTRTNTRSLLHQHHFGLPTSSSRTQSVHSSAVSVSTSLEQIRQQLITKRTIPFRLSNQHTPTHPCPKSDQNPSTRLKTRRLLQRPGTTATTTILLPTCLPPARHRLQSLPQIPNTTTPPPPAPFAKPLRPARPRDGNPSARQKPRPFQIPNTTTNTTTAMGPRATKRRAHLEPPRRRQQQQQEEEEEEEVVVVVRAVGR